MGDSYNKNTKDKIGRDKMERDITIILPNINNWNSKMDGLCWRISKLEENQKVKLDMGKVLFIEPQGIILLYRIEKGWSESELLSGPRKRNSIRKHTGKTLVINQIEKSYSEWAEIIGINQATLRDRVNAGWKEDEILKPKGYRRKNIYCF